MNVKMQVKQNNMSRRSIVESDGCCKLRTMRFLNINMKVKIQYCVVLVACLLSSFCLAELPPLESLNLKEQIIIAELSRDVMPDANMVIRKAAALDRNDHNKDGVIDFQDFAIFVDDWNAAKASFKQPKHISHEGNKVVFQDANTTVYEINKKETPIIADFNDLQFINYYLNDYLEN